MFFRRMFTRKDENNAKMQSAHAGKDNYNTQHQHRASAGSSLTPRSLRKFQPQQQQQHFSASSIGLGKNHATTTGSVIQLTPLWEYILRTRTLPQNICPLKMFDEFFERLRDPEWQVRQHALRVLVDVLVVLGSKADNYMDPLVAQLVENLGHPAPTVRKGALDCLRVYLAETAMPETILLQILDIGLNQKITNEPFGGRLTCGVMLSLPALVQSTLHTQKRNFILRSSIDMLVQKMGQVTHQEITLKVLSKFRELIGPREFAEFLSHSAYREFELLCSVYGVGAVPQQYHVIADSNASGDKSWRNQSAFTLETGTCSANRADTCWLSSDDKRISDCSKVEDNCGKVIMETEFKINDDTLTMRILEAKDDCSEIISDSSCKTDLCNLQDEVVTDLLPSSGRSRDGEPAGIVQLLSDSEVEEINQKRQYMDNYYTKIPPSIPTPRTPKRVTFGGEIVKMRTPDSDTAPPPPPHAKMCEESGAGSAESKSKKVNSDVANKTNLLSVEIPNDNTKPVSRRQTRAETPNQQTTQDKTDNPDENRPLSTLTESTRKEEKEPSLSHQSPRSPFKRINISPVDNIISPKTSHKQIEVLHNLQRDPSPVRARRSSLRPDNETTNETENLSNDSTANRLLDRQQNKLRSWEDLGIVNSDVLKNLRSGDWRHRSHGICGLEDALRSSENLGRVQPCLDTLLRTLLSSERNPDVAEDKRRVLMNLISRLPLDNLEDRTVQIITGLCRQGGAGSNRCCKSLMQRLPPAVIVLKLISDDFLHAKSSRFRENALQMVMYALMTFPSTCFDTTTCVTSATFAALDRKKRVRQAALDVLAILGQVTSPRAVMDVVQSIAVTRDNGNNLFAAVKARLSRKQLPLVSADGTVQYTLRVPSPKMAENGSTVESHLGSDIEWIASGVGSVSPTSIKRRAQRHGYFYTNNREGQQDDFCSGHRCRAPHELLAFGVGVRESPPPCDIGGAGGGINDASHSNHNIQYVLGSSVPVQFNAAAKKSCGDLVDLKSHRLGTKSCSDSSMDGRSSDSTYTTSSSGDRTSELDCANGINGRFTRQSVNSRFPTMERIDLTGGSLYNVQRQSHRVQNHRQCPVMGASQYYQQHQQYNSHNLNATYPKVNYTLHAAKQPHGSQRNYHQQQSNHNHKYYGSQEAFYQESHFGENSNALDGTYTVSNGPADCATTTMIDNQANNGGNSSRRFVNVEKFIMQSNKSTTESIQSPVAATKTPPPPSNTSITNSKETAIIEVPKEQEAIVKQPVQERTKSSLSDETTLHTKEDVLQSPAQSIASAIITQQEKASYVCSTPTTTLVETIQSAPIDNDVGSVSTAKWSTEEILQIEDIVDATPSTPVTPLPLAKSEDLVRPASVQSRAESIKTQLEYSTPLSRSHSVQSAKSVVIEEELEGPVSNSISLVDSYHHDSAAHTPEEVAKVETNENVHLADTYIKDLLNNADNDEDRSFTPAVVPPRSLTSEENNPHSRKSSIAKSLESLVYEKSSFKQGSPENCTETSSESSQLNNNSVSSNYIPTKPQYTPPKRKSRTSCFLKSNRRVSPVKQSIKMSQAELFPQALTRFEKPREALNKTCDQLDSSNWEEIVVALKSMVRLMRHHPDTLDCQMHMVCIQLTKSVRNLRSQVSRAACQASTELFTIKSKFLEQECDDLVCALLHRTADTNRFLRADASRGLESMCDNLAPPKVLNILTTRGALHQNAIVRTTAAKLLTRLADRLGCEKIFTMGRENRDKFFLTGANLLLEGSLETRGYAKSLFRLLSDHHNYSRLLLEVIPTRTYRNIEKTLKSIR